MTNTLNPRWTYAVNFATGPWGDPGRRVPLTDPDVNAFSSEVSDNRHWPVIDIDYPAALVPSTTPGHFHLYLDRDVEWSKYRKVLEALADAGLIQDGFMRASVKRRKTYVRLPWVKKKPGEDGSE